ncbi:MAG: hypothetical protein DME43_13065 [Verrucomicrobia bacterium]|nr:MAG: hypothetical protein DME43_13065 [Verrucomicrobiota bacterium]
MLAGCPTRRTPFQSDWRFTETPYNFLSSVGESSSARPYLYPMTFETRRVIPADHPSLAGHFPCAPIVPGVVVLDEVVAALAEWRQDSQLTGIPSVKFIGPIKPGQSFVVGFNSTNTAENQIDFCCRLDRRVVVEGRLEISCGACI